MAGLQGRAFGGYQLTEPLGAAGIAEVYRARPTKPGGREAVVKVIYPEFARQPGFLPHFRQLVQQTSKLASHPHILPTLGSGEEGGYLYLISPYVAAGTLNDLLARGGRMGPADIGPFFRQLCEALGYAHSLGVAHGNVKPSNIFLYEGRHVMLGDFGLLWDVAHMDVNQASSGGDALEYMAPEVAQGQLSPFSDIYSTGAVIFATITGSPPFRGPRPADILAAHAQRPVPHLAQVNPTLPPQLLALDVVTQRAMAKRPEGRFPSAAALAQAIESTIRQSAQLPQQGMPAQLGQSPQAANPPPQLGAAAPWGIPGVTANVIPPLGVGLGQAAAALFNAPPAPPALESQNPSIRPVGPQFPPLPASATVDESMQNGGASLRQSDMYQPGGSSLTYEPTNRIPAASYHPPVEPARSPVLGDDGGWGNPADVPSDDNARGPWQLKRAIPGLGKRLGQSGNPSASDPQAPYGADDNYNGFSIPAIRGSSPEADAHAGGFSVAGGAADWMQRPSADTSGPLPQTESQELQAWVATGDQSLANGDSGEVRTFSPTQLGLPRLTSPSLSNMPPSWQELLDSPMPPSDDPRRWHPAGMVESGMQHSMPEAPWRSNPDLQSEAWSQDSAEWAGPNSGPVGWMESGVQARVSGGAVKKMPSWQEVNQVPREDDLRFDTRFAKKGRIRLRGKPGLLSRLVLVLLLLIVADIGIVEIAHPEYCPISACVSISNRLHQALPFLPSNTAPAVAVLTATPSSVTFSVANNKSTSASLAITNATSTSLDWQATVSPTWLSITPDSNTLAVGGSANLTVTAKPTDLSPNSYPAKITITTPHGTLTIPVTVTVTSAPSPTPTV